MTTHIYKGKYFEADLVDETLEVIPTEELRSHLFFTRSESQDMIRELQNLLDKDKDLMEK